MATVIFTKYEQYNPQALQRLLMQMLEEGNLAGSIRPGERILLKPNLLSARQPDAGVTTHPAIVEAVAKAVLQIGATPVISDSPGGAIRGTKRVLENTGMANVAKRLGIETVPLETLGARTFELDDGETLYLTRFLDDVDGIINIPKLKTHSLILTTFAIKNLYGLVPGFRKAEYHKIYPSPKKFAWLLAEIYTRVSSKIRFTVMDGIVAMDGNGPSSGRLRNLGILALSDDAAAMESAFERLVGLKSPSPVMRELLNREIVPHYSLKWIGEPIRHIEDFQIPSNWIMRFVPSWFTRLAGTLVRVYPGVDLEKCIKCGECFRSCPVNAISMEAGKTPPAFDYGKCIRCLCCHEICPEKAVVFRKSWLASFIK